MQPYNNQQQPYYNFQQQTPGPPQPPWQSNSPRRGWQDPRLQQASAQATASPISPYAPTTFGPISGQNLPPPPPNPPPLGNRTHSPQPPQITQYDTSSWGVKYNQHQPSPFQQQEIKPPLPPRPSSAVGGQYGWQDSQINVHQPPTPPPRPPQYAAQNQVPQPSQGEYFPHEQYSQHAATNHYEPAQANWQPTQHTNAPSAPPWNQVQGYNDEPVSPIEADVHRWSISGPPFQSNYGHPSSNQGHGYTQSVHPSATNQSHPEHTPGSSALAQGSTASWQHYQTSGQYSHVNDLSHGLVSTPEQVETKPTHHQRIDAVRPPPMTPPPQDTLPHQQTQTQHNQHTPKFQDAHAVDQAARPRLESHSSASSISLPTRTGTIDSVIQAWNSPQSHTGARSGEDASAARTPHLQSAAVIKPAEMSNSGTQTDFPPIVKTETKVETRVEVRDMDPYADIKDEYRTSLNRYAATLRQESLVPDEVGKMKIFQDFVTRELKLRSALYSVDAPELITSAELLKLREAADRPTQNLTVHEPEPPAVAQTKPPDLSVQTASLNVPTTQSAAPGAAGSKDDGFIVVGESGEDTEYSPGGRPRIAQPMAKPSEQPHQAPSNDAKQSQSSVIQTLQGQSPSSNAPMTLEDYVMPDRASPTWDAPIVVGPDDVPHSTTLSPGPTPQSAVITPIHFQPARPAYTPFRYNEASSTPPPILTVNHPANESYAKLRHDQSADSGRLLRTETPVITTTDSPDRRENETPSFARQQQEEAFIGLLRKQSQAVRKPSPSPSPMFSNAPAPLRAGTPYRRASIPPLTAAVSSIRTLLPQALPHPVPSDPPHPQIASLIDSSSKIPDDFSFIHATVIAWDKQNRQIRRQLDDERAARESENQIRVDQLFHDNEIGYADIADLEEDFKIEEAAKKYQEDQDELDSFITNVFDVVTGRLDGELSELSKLRINAIDLMELKSASASRRMQATANNIGHDTDLILLSEAMDLVLGIFNKIEIRHTKMAEARFERERRRKRLELGVLYVNGDSAGMKQLEKDFDKAQALQVLAEARKRDERANSLMDSFDRVVARGLGENQEWIDNVLNKASLLRDLVLGSESNGPAGQQRDELLYGEDGVKQTVTSLQNTVSMVLQDSTTLVKTLNKAVTGLNEADFAIALSEAQIAQSDANEFEKLKLDKSKEDLKLAEEFEGRINGVTRGPEEINNLIREVRDWVGADKEHRARIEKALQEAKKRNAATPAPVG